MKNEEKNKHNKIELLTSAALPHETGIGLFFNVSILVAAGSKGREFYNIFFLFVPPSVMLWHGGIENFKFLTNQG